MKVSGNLLSFGSLGVFEFSRQSKVISGKLIGLAKSEMAWGGGGGRFTPLMAQAAAEFVKGKIESQGEGLPSAVNRPITKKWREAKKKYAKPSELPLGPHYATGALYRSIKVLSRRSRGSGRYFTVGVSQKETVPHFGYGGISADRTVKVSDYAHNIEIGADKPRPLIISAIIAFAETVWPTGKKTLQKARDNFLKDNFSIRALKKGHKDNIEAEMNKATRKMVKTLVSECGYSQAAAVKMADAVRK